MPILLVIKILIAKNIVPFPFLQQLLLVSIIVLLETVLANHGREVWTSNNSKNNYIIISQIYFNILIHTNLCILLYSRVCTRKNNRLWPLDFKRLFRTPVYVLQGFQICRWEIFLFLSDMDKRKLRHISSFWLLDFTIAIAWYLLQFNQTDTIYGLNIAYKYQNQQFISYRVRYQTVAPIQYILCLCRVQI